jgi:phospholipid/cholesterol/gamma-HCH transport system substrate-binding protein
LNQERNPYVISTRASVSGLNPESTVFFRGIPVGKVISIRFDPDDSGIILVPIEVDKHIVLTKGVYAILQLKGVTGLTQIELEDDGTISQALPAGDNALYRIPLKPSLTDKLLDSGEILLKKADHLMLRLSALLNDENEKNISGILGNLKNVSDKLARLEASVDKALAGVPGLTEDTRQTLAHINELSLELQSLSKEVKILGSKTAELIDTSKAAGDLAVQITLPKINDVLTDLQVTSRQVQKVAALLEANPQAILLGAPQTLPGPGEPGYQEPK